MSALFNSIKKNDFDSWRASGAQDEPNSRAADGASIPAGIGPGLDVAATRGRAPLARNGACVVNRDSSSSRGLGLLSGALLLAGATAVARDPSASGQVAQAAWAPANPGPAPQEGARQDANGLEQMPRANAAAASGAFPMMLRESDWNPGSVQAGRLLPGDPRTPQQVKASRSSSEQAHQRRLAEVDQVKADTTPITPVLLSDVEVARFFGRDVGVWWASKGDGSLRGIEFGDWWKSPCEAYGRRVLGSDNFSALVEKVGLLAAVREAEKADPQSASLGVFGPAGAPPIPVQRQGRYAPDCGGVVVHLEEHEYLSSRPDKSAVSEALRDGYLSLGYLVGFFVDPNSQVPSILAFPPVNEAFPCFELLKTIGGSDAGQALFLPDPRAVEVFWRDHHYPTLFPRLPNSPGSSDDSSVERGFLGAFVALTGVAGAAAVATATAKAKAWCKRSDEQPAGQDTAVAPVVQNGTGAPDVVRSHTV